MLQNLSMDKRLETRWKKWNRYLRNNPWNGYKNRRQLFLDGITEHIEPKVNVRGFKRFKKTSVTGIYIVDDVNTDEDSIKSCTKQSCKSLMSTFPRDKNGNVHCSFILCDNPQQAKEFYDSLDIKGNHVILMTEMYDFRWHKWGEYIGENYAEHCHEYFSDDQKYLNMYKPIYHAAIYKVV